MPGEEDQIDTDILALEEEDVVGFEEGEQPQGDDGEVTVIAFADDEAEEEPALVKTLRDQIRDRDRKIAQMRRAPAASVDNDPEPEVAERPRSVADFDYDEDRFNAAIDEHLAAKEAHGAWRARQTERQAAQQRAAEEQAKRVEKQKNALGLRDYDTRSATVRGTLSDAQLAVLINGVDDPARMIAALGAPGAQTRLTQLAGEDNLAKFAVMLGSMNREIKVTKRTAANPESMVRGATGTLSSGAPDKHLERLEREAEKTGNRGPVQAYKRQLKQQRAA